jgi:hypothetical protein
VENAVPQKNRAPLRGEREKEKKGAACAAPEKGKRIKGKRVPTDAFS